MAVLTPSRIVVPIIWSSVRNAYRSMLLVVAFLLVVPAKAQVIELVKDIALGSENSRPTYLTEFGGELFFSAYDDTHDEELWKSDGSASGTVLVKDIWPGTGWGSYPSSLTEVGGYLFFRAEDETHGPELWKSDGTAAGTVLVKDVWTGSSDGRPVGLAELNGELFFNASDGTHGRELWKSDGTAAGTVLVKDIKSGSGGPGSGSPGQLTEFGGELFFTADDGTHGRELWKSDGTPAGTVLVKDINPGSGDSGPQQFAEVDGELFFNAFDGTHGSELWKSDGTAAGTVLVKDIYPGNTYASSDPFFLMEFGGELFFRAQTPPCCDNRELWKSDGTAAGTVLVKDIFPGSDPSNVQDFTEFAGELFFTAHDGTHGRELWKSDGTPAGTVLVKDIFPGSGDSNPSEFREFGGDLFFTARDGTHGVELWVLRGDNGPPTTTNVVTTPNPVQVDAGVSITASVDDVSTGGSAIASAHYSIDGGVFTSMMASDGAFDSQSENVEAVIGGFSDAGVREVCVVGTDFGGNTSEAQCTFLAVYDPDGGFVTGGGWIESPRGAYVLDPTLTGKATFGFVSKYQRNKSEPSGNTQFRFHAGDLAFASQAYDWLIVAHHKAMFKGTGKIRGNGNYGFQLSAIDAALTPSTDMDHFRIRIWDKDNADALVYDNQVGESDNNADPTTALAGGSIVIHEGTKKKTDELAGLPTEFALYGNYPNPFNPSTSIRFDLPEHSEVRLVVFDLLGREVAILADQQMPQGRHSVTWEADNAPSGVFMCRIEAGDYVKTRPMVLLK